MFSLLKKTIFFVFLLAFIGCDEDVPKERDVTYLYYYNNAGFKEILTNDNEGDYLAGNAVDRCTGVAENGIVIFKYSNVTQALWGKCENGSLIAVPIPESTDDNYKYSLNTKTSERLAYKGHHLAYFCDYKTISTGKIEVQLVIFNCEIGEATIVPFKSFLLNELSEEGVMDVNIAGSMLINNSGDQVWFTVENYDEDKNSLGYSIVLWNNGILSILGNKITDKFTNLLGLSVDTGSILFEQLKEIFLLKQDNSIEQLSYNFDQFTNTRMFSKVKSEIVLWTDFGIEIHTPDNGNVIKQVISYDELKSQLPEYDIQRNHTLSMAPDGHMLTVSFPRKNTELWDIFYFDSEVTEIHKIATNDVVNTPALSPLITIED
jgi:hypothetical protein